MKSSQHSRHLIKNPYSQLRDHDKVDRVVTFDDHHDYEGAMVILDWVTDATMTDSGTRLIHEKNYDGHIRTISKFIENLPGVEKTGQRKTGIAEYTFHVRRTTEA